MARTITRYNLTAEQAAMLRERLLSAHRFDSADYLDEQLVRFKRTEIIVSETGSVGADMLVLAHYDPEVRAILDAAAVL